MQGDDESTIRRKMAQCLSRMSELLRRMASTHKRWFESGSLPGFPNPVPDILRDVEKLRELFEKYDGLCGSLASVMEYSSAELMGWDKWCAADTSVRWLNNLLAKVWKECDSHAQAIEKLKAECVDRDDSDEEVQRHLESVNQHYYMKKFEALKPIWADPAYAESFNRLARGFEDASESYRRASGALPPTPHALAALPAPLGAADPTPGTAHAPGAVKPKWDKKARTLTFGETQWHFLRLARNQFQILDAFESQGWSPSIRSPFDDQTSLAQTIKDFNNLIDQKVIGKGNFRLQRDNTRVIWEVF
jgi:hypothetical protein